MKKFLSLLAVLAVMVFMGSTVFAAQIGTSKAAFATFTAAPLSFDVTYYHWSGSGDYCKSTDEVDQTTANIQFDASDVTVGVTTDSVAISSDYIKIHSNLNEQPANTFIYVYTDNKNNTDDFAAVSGKVEGSTTTYNGLVRKGQGATYNDGDFAALQTKFVKISSANANITGGPKTATFLDDEQYAGDRWMADKSNIYNGTAWTRTGEDSFSIIGKSGVGGGIWVGYGADGSAPASNWYSQEDVIMFFKAVFNNVNGGDQYGTNTIKFVNMTE